MDPKLVGGEIEYFLLTKAARRPQVSAYDLSLGKVEELLPYLDKRFPGAEVGRAWIEHAVKVTASLSMQGHDTVCLSLAEISSLPRPLSPQRLSDYLERHRPARVSYLLAVRPPRLTLSTAPQTVEVVNEGHAVARDLRIERVLAAADIAATFRGRKLTLRLTDVRPGVYSGRVRIVTNHGHVDLEVAWEGDKMPALRGKLIDPQTLFPAHEFLDLDATVCKFEARLLDGGYSRTVGGCYVRNDSRLHKVPKSVPPTARWTLTAEQIAKGRLPGRGHLRKTKIFAPDGSMFFEAEADGAALHGPGLLELFELWEVKPGQKLSLEPYRGHWRAVFGDELDWLYRPTQRRILVASIVQAEQREDFWSILDRWTADGEVMWLLRGPSDPRIVQLAQRRPDRFRFIHTAEEQHPARLYTGESHAYDWFTGKVLKIEPPEITVLKARPEVRSVEEQEALKPEPELEGPKSPDPREAFEVAVIELVKRHQPISGNDIVNLYVEALGTAATAEDHRRARNLFRSFAPQACRAGRLVTRSPFGMKGVLYEFYSLPEPAATAVQVAPKAAEPVPRRVRGQTWKR